MNTSNLMLSYPMKLPTHHSLSVASISGAGERLIQLISKPRTQRVRVRDLKYVSSNLSKDKQLLFVPKELGVFANGIRSLA